MAGGRHTPLFEAMQRQAARTRLAAAAREERAAAKAAPRERPSRDQLLEPTRARLTGGTLRVPVYGLYVAITVVGVAGFLLWGLAYNLGASRGEEKALGRLGMEPGGGAPTAIATDGPREREERANPERPPDLAPIRRDSSIPGGPSEAGSGDPLGADVDRDDPLPAASMREGWARWIGESGPLANDPRRTGLVYLKLESTVWGDEAVRAVEFCAEQEFPILAVLVDMRTRDGKNLALYDLYATGLIDGRRDAVVTNSEKSQFVSRAKSVGRSWSATREGTATFSSPYWSPYRGR